MNLFAELKRRNVIRMGGLYLVGSWLVVQVAETLLPVFGTPEWVLKTLILLLAIGFVPALVFSWLYELTPDGLKRDAEVDPTHSIAPRTAARLDQLTLVALALVVALIAADRWWPKQEDASQDVVVTQPVTSETIKQTPPASPAEMPVVSDRSVAVLPFVNMSNDPEQEYFSDGISEELLNRLAQIPDLQVAARTSAFQFKGKNLDIADIGRQLRVAHVLEGSVRKAGIKLRITAQLIDSRSGFHLWSESYDRDATDVFRVQDEIASEIARALKTTLGVQGASASPAESADPEAFDDYLLGRSYVAKRGLENLGLAIKAFDRAIASDAQFSAAHSGRAFAYLLQPMWGSGEAGLSLREASASAARSLQLDPENAEGMMVRGMAASFSYRVSDALIDLERALALAPNNVDILNMYGDYLTNAGALGEAERIKREAMLRDPLAMVHPLNLADILLAQARPEEAMKFAEQAQALGGAAFALDRVVLAAVHLAQPKRAAQAAEEVCALGGSEYDNCIANRALAMLAKGQREAARAKLVQWVDRKIETDLVEDQPILDQMPVYFVELGDIEAATRLQRRCLDRGCWFPTYALFVNSYGIALPEEISTDPDWLAVWADPRIADVMTEFRRNVLAWRAEKR